MIYLDISDLFTMKILDIMTYLAFKFKIIYLKKLGNKLKHEKKM